MKTARCCCGNLLFFDSLSCVRCQRQVGFLPDVGTLCSFDLLDDKHFRAAEKPESLSYKKCGNWDLNACNWMVHADSSEPFCTSCRMNLIIPNLSNPENVRCWRLVEGAKRRLIYSALNLSLPVRNRVDDPKNGLGFQFLANTTRPDGTVQRVMTGHEYGIITLNVEEADDSAREKIRLGMKEPYRTLLGHFRHESGHYYWDRLVGPSPLLARSRELFGDERQDYGQALKVYYDKGPRADWQVNCISAYSTMHPSEDWAETWAHFLHIYDTLEVAADFGFVSRREKLIIDRDADLKEKAKRFNSIMESWSELTVALNSMNRSMGIPDLYPFILSKPVVEKLFFVSEVIALNQK